MKQPGLGFAYSSSPGLHNSNGLLLQVDRQQLLQRFEDLRPIFKRRLHSMPIFELSYVHKVSLLILLENGPGLGRQQPISLSLLEGKLEVDDWSQRHIDQFGTAEKAVLLWAVLAVPEGPLFLQGLLRIVELLHKLIVGLTFFEGGVEIFEFQMCDIAEVVTDDGIVLLLGPVEEEGI